MISVDQLADVFVDVSDTRRGDFDVVDFVQTVMDRAALISGAMTVGVLLADAGGELHGFAPSRTVRPLLELLRLQTEDGPCLECFVTAAAVDAPDLARETSRWPVFAPAAIEAGVRSVYSCPMRRREQMVGALSLFGRSVAAFAPAEVRVVQALADLATIALVHQRTLAEARTVAAQLQEALDSRVVIEQAKGAIAQKEGIVPAEAFQKLRARARGSGRRLTSVAGEVLEEIEARPVDEEPEDGD